MSLKTNYFVNFDKYVDEVYKYLHENVSSKARKLPDHMHIFHGYIKDTKEVYGIDLWLNGAKSKNGIYILLYYGIPTSSKRDDIDEIIEGDVPKTVDNVRVHKGTMDGVFDEAWVFKKTHDRQAIVDKFNLLKEFYKQINKE